MALETVERVNRKFDMFSLATFFDHSHDHRAVEG